MKSHFKKFLLGLAMILPIFWQQPAHAEIVTGGDPDSVWTVDYAAAPQDLNDAADAAFTLPREAQICRPVDEIWTNITNTPANEALDAADAAFTLPREAQICRNNDIWTLGLLDINTSPAAICSNGLKDSNEADVDCGGFCNAKCALGKNCGANSDCASGMCLAGICADNNPVDLAIIGPIKFNEYDQATDDGATYPAEELKIEVQVKNVGTSTANDVTVRFMIGDQYLETRPIGSLNAGESRNVPVKWNIWGNIEKKLVKIKIKSFGRTDANPNDNEISQEISFYYVDFDHNRDAFSFENWGSSKHQDYENEFNDFIAAHTTSEQLNSFRAAKLILFAGMIKEMSSGGHCYGMAAASADYYLDPQKKIAAVDTFKMSPGIAKPVIINYHWSQFTKLLPLLTSLSQSTSIFNPDPKDEFAKILDQVKKNTPAVISMRNSTGIATSINHSILAYKVLDLGLSDKRVYVYENNKPYDDPNDNYTLNPEKKKNQDYYIAFNLDPAKSNGSYGEYEKIYAIDTAMTNEPFWDYIQTSTQNILAGMRESGKKMFLWTKSPVTSLLTDEYGRRIGYAGNEFINEIPGARMETIIDSRLFTLPMDLHYRVNVTAIGDGTVGFDFVIPTSNTTARVASYEDIPIKTGDGISFNYDQSHTPHDVTLNNETDYQPVVSSVFDATTMGAPADNVAPVTNAVADGVMGQNGFYRSDVAVNFSAADGAPEGVAPSGIQSINYALDGAANTIFDADNARITVSGEGKHTLIYYSLDNVDNQEAARTLEFTIDKTGPTMAPTVTPNPVILGAAVTVLANAADPLSGVATQSCENATTSAVGNFVLNCAATDNAGNTRALAVPYQVVYRFDGFLPPVDNKGRTAGPQINIFNAGRTVPVKFQIKNNAGGAVKAANLPAWITPVSLGPITAAIKGSINNEPATKGTYFRWDESNQQYIYNWSTKGIAGGYYYRIGAILDDGTIASVVIGLR